MNNHEKLDLVRKQYGSLQNPDPPMPVDWMTTVAWNLLFDRNDLDGVCLVYLHAGNKIGIADRNVKGYTPTPCFISNGVNGQEAVNWFNENILGLSLDESARIVFSTMRKE